MFAEPNLNRPRSTNVVLRFLSEEWATFKTPCVRFLTDRKESENYNTNILDYGILAAILFLVIAIGVFIFVVWVNKD